MFHPVSKQFDVPALEQTILRYWAENDVVGRYLRRNEDAEERFSFLDGPITANGPMGVHHAWGRTYKDLWQRYNTMLGKRQRYQNGFDCQGLWVEVTTERQLGFTSKRDIERYGIPEFVQKCKESVFAFADLQTRQSQRLGYFMDWDHSYYTLSDENNYTIWHFLKTCHERGLLYQGTDVMPWCTRCGTGISETEAAEGYQDLTHRAVFVRMPLLDEPGAALLVWTTTPWTLTSNVAVAVNPELTYVKVRQGDELLYVAHGALAALRGPYEVVEQLAGEALLARPYAGPFDEFEAQSGVEHVVIPWADVSADEGTGLVHIAPGCGKEDFALGKANGLPAIAPLDQNGVYGSGFGPLTGRNVQDVAGEIVDLLQARGVLYREEAYAHRYPTCWRCGTELVFRLVEEWFISMDPLREPMMEVVRKIRWLPAFGREREIDWLRNMSDWMISKKRYWGLALPFWICPNGHLQVVGSKDELFARATGGLEQLESPHRPWIDAVQLACPECGESAQRIADVGNPWLDAGIVPFSTLKYDSDQEYWRAWFPADFITESFPGQFRNWFYSLLAMSTVLVDSNPFDTVLGYALVRDQTGREMHKSWGNLIPFDEAADRSGADIMRWLFCLHNPDSNLSFGWESLEEVKRRLLVLWNTYSFFVTYANVDGWSAHDVAPPPAERALLDRWILARLQEVTRTVRDCLDQYDAMNAARSLERFIEDLSTWYVRLSRRRFWKAENDADKAGAYATLYSSLTGLSTLLAPFMPFLAEELYGNLVRTQDDDVPVSIHITDYLTPDAALLDAHLLDAMRVAQQVIALGRVARERAGLNVRQPLNRLYLKTPDAGSIEMIDQVRSIILQELNVKELVHSDADEEFAEYSIRPNLPVLGPRFGKRIPEVRRGLAALDPAEVARTVGNGETLTLTAGEQTVTLEPEEILVTAREREGYAAMAENGYLVALDTRLTPELVQEGYARSVVRHLNNWRKEAGFRVEDRITVRYEGTPELSGAIELHGEYIRAETLAVELTSGRVGAEGFVAETEFSGQRLCVELQRAEVDLR